MRIEAVISALLLTASCLSGCSLIDSRTEWRSGRYVLMWIDEPNEVTLSYDLGDGAWKPLVDARVFAVGSDSHHIIAKQHPHGDKGITNYFILDTSDILKSAGVTGPLSEAEFERKIKELNLPAFSKTLKSLE
ncbi:MAG: hypothetical protein ACHQ51_02215 [Elusimicrobiota bacterium]